MFSNKLLAEGTPSEKIIALSWNIDGRAFTITLTEDKNDAWSHQISEMLRQKCGAHKELESRAGQLNYDAIAIPLCRHFIGRLRSLIIKYETLKRIRIEKEVVLDLKLWLCLLKRANQVISFKLVLERRPDSTIIVDYCEYGL